MKKTDLTQLIKDIKDGKVLPDSLTLAQEEDICFYLDSKGKPATEVAEVIGRCARTVRNRLKDAKKKLARAYSGSSEQWVGHLIQSAALARQDSLSRKRFKQAFEIDLKLFEKLQSVGIIDEKVNPGELNIKLGQNMRIELEPLTNEEDFPDEENDDVEEGDEEDE